MASGVRVMEKAIQLQQQRQQLQQHHQPHEALKCPRCDSSNTKFCYYNNYSLSQPRHFCKSCKRYWTRGGTLRNVPVGGGCRKNKRVKRPITTTVHAVATPPLVNHPTNTNPNPNPNLELPSSSTTSSSYTNHHLNPLFYGLLPQNPNFAQLETMVSTANENLVSCYNLLQPRLNASRLGFSSLGMLGGSLVASHNSNLKISSYNSSIYGDGSTSSSSGAPTMSSLLASSLNQQQRFVGFANYDNLSMAKDLKMEETQKKMEWNDKNHFHGPDKNEHIEGVVSSNPNSLLWDIERGGWIDQIDNIGSSVPSLI